MRIKKTSQYIEGGAGLPSYFTTETNTGMKWIDGKTIYRKVVEFTTTNTAYTYTTQASGLSNVETICSLSGFIKDGTIFTPINEARIHSDAIYNNDYSWFRMNGGQINYEVASGLTSKSAYVIVEYTKSS